MMIFCRVLDIKQTNFCT